MVPVFPLPEMVLFPRQVMPLHIFEPRYRAMVADVLAGSKAIAVALLKPNYESCYFTPRAPIHGLVGVGRIIGVKKLADGKSNIVLRGEARATIVEEVSGRSYRFARVRTLETTSGASLETRRRLREELCDAIRRHVGDEASACYQYLQLFEEARTLGELVDLIAGGLPVVGELRQCLLAELDACARARLLLDLIRTRNILAQMRRPRQNTETGLN
jgi:Lon protease-like protein